jgi:hypothetical protein
MTFCGDNDHRGQPPRRAPGRLEPVRLLALRLAEERCSPESPRSALRYPRAGEGRPAATGRGGGPRALVGVADDGDDVSCGLACPGRSGGTDNQLAAYPPPVSAGVGALPAEGVVGAADEEPSTVGLRDEADGRCAEGTAASRRPCPLGEGGSRPHGVVGPAGGDLEGILADATAAGAVDRCPPSRFQLLSGWPGRKVRTHSAWSAPRMNTSIRPRLVPVIAGAADSVPPQLVHGPQVPLCIIRSRSVLSAPRAATTRVVRATPGIGSSALFASAASRVRMN